MNTRPVEPRGSVGGPLTPFLMLGLAWAVIALMWLSWLAGWIAAAVTGQPAIGPGFGSAYLEYLLRTEWSALWPGASPTVVGLVFAVLLLMLVCLITLTAMWWQGRKPDAEDPLPSLAGPAEVRAMTLSAVAAKARRLRRGLADAAVREISAESAGVVLGAHRRRRGSGPRLYSSWEDVILAVMAPRAGKTTAMAVQSVLGAPGAALATSNKPDLWATTAALRAERGSVWVFDPQSIAHVPQGWWWNPLASVEDVEDAHRLANHFVQQVRNSQGSDDFWIQGAQDLLTSLILAAALEGRTLTSVQAWLSDSTSREPATILKSHGFGASARAMSGRQAGAPETREGLYETARTAAACLANPTIMAWVTPPDLPLPTLEVEAFVESADTLYLLSKDGAGAAAPLVAGLTDQVLRAAVTLAEAHGGRLDPPLVACLDEAANICKIADLPELYSHLGSRGIIPLTILQSYRQGTRVWGERGMDALWSAATVKLIGAGIDDARFAEDLSRLVGEHDVTVASRTRDGKGHTSYQTSVRRQRILDPAHIRALPKRSALLFATGVKVAMLNLLPWYDEPSADRLTAAVAASTAEMTRQAQRTRAARRDRLTQRSWRGRAG
ncbi:type IV secretory system conjugative DNA transfer family protein [Micromonospora arida]|uniref:Conjugal transfer protein TraG n=1 Tax=Micromonospora arida TaxID=2203715 RepID=A0A3N9WPT3_9ACTN|nr:type IV secretory system conjugative DNA transfer family protein [Micromonospora arida]RQX02816.1 conjugal transfer protein TraG [Micromonospora arida]